MHVDLIKYKCTVYLGYNEQCTDRDPLQSGRLGDAGAGSFLDSSRGGSGSGRDFLLKKPKFTSKPSTRINAQSMKACSVVYF